MNTKTHSGLKVHQSYLMNSRKGLTFDRVSLIAEKMKKINALTFKSNYFKNKSTDFLKNDSKSFRDYCKHYK